MSYIPFSMRCMICGEESGGKNYCNHCYRLLQRGKGCKKLSKFLDWNIENKKGVDERMVKLEDKPFVIAEDLKDGETFTIIDEGEYREQDFGTEDKPDIRRMFDITISVKGIEYTWTMNKTTRLNFIRGFGNNTKEWINKKGKFTLVKQNVFGNIKNIIYGSPLTAKNGKVK